MSTYVYISRIATIIGGQNSSSAPRRPLLMAIPLLHPEALAAADLIAIHYSFAYLRIGKVHEIVQSVTL